MNCSVGQRCGSDPTLLWLWYRPAATAPIRPLVWEPPYAAGAAQEMAKDKKKERKKERKKIPFTIASVRLSRNKNKPAQGSKRPGLRKLLRHSWKKLKMIQTDEKIYQNFLFFNFNFNFFVFLGPHMEVPRLGVWLEPQPPAYATTTEIWDLSHVSDLHHSSWQCWIHWARPGIEPSTHGS